MKMLHTLILAASAAASFSTFAEGEAPHSQHPVERPEGSGKDRERPSFRRFGDGQQVDGSYVDRWLESVKERNPEEFERARKMREENPEEFKKHLHKKLEEMRMKGWQQHNGSLRDRPRVMEALNQLPPEDREWAMQRLQQAPFIGNRGDGLPDIRHPFSAEIQRLEERSREQARKCREAEGEDAKRVAKLELRATLSEIFDHREKLRAESLKMIEEKLTKLRQGLEEQQQNRDKIIDTRLEEVLRDYPGQRRQP